jgi:predicted molibdopterin-dependent oxidoreductase YjgC
MGILRACADREIDVLFLIGTDPLRDVPDGALARRALDNVETVVVQSLELGAYEPFADAFLPAAATIEKDGHLTNWEGRSQRIRPVRAAAGLSRPDWEIFASLALALGGDLGFETLDQLHEEMGRLISPRPWGTTAAITEPLTPTKPDETVFLFSYPLLIDDGRLSRRADELVEALGEEAFVEVHPQTAAAFGLETAEAAVVRTDAGEGTLPLRITEHIALGAAFVPFNQPGFAANTLLSGSFTTVATLAPSGDPVATTPEPVGDEAIVGAGGGVA